MHGWMGWARLPAPPAAVALAPHRGSPRADAIRIACLLTDMHAGQETLQCRGQARPCSTRLHQRLLPPLTGARSNQGQAQQQHKAGLHGHCARATKGRPCGGWERRLLAAAADQPCYPLQNRVVGGGARSAAAFYAPAAHAAASSSGRCGSDLPPALTARLKPGMLYCYNGLGARSVAQ